MNTQNVSTPPRASMRTRLIAAALIFAGITGATLAFAGSASATTTVIDASTKSGAVAAAAAMAQFATATDKSFTPEADPLYQSTGWAAPEGTSIQNNGGKAGAPDTPVSWSFSSTKTASWQLGGEVDLSAGGGIGFANVSVSVALSASHTWGTSTTDTETIQGSVPPQMSQWILESTSQAVYTGTYRFTAADGTVYEVDNVKITTPVGPGNNPNAAVNYRVVEQPTASVNAALGLPAAASVNLNHLTTAQINQISHKLGLTKTDDGRGDDGSEHGQNRSGRTHCPVQRWAMRCF